MGPKEERKDGRTGGRKGAANPAGTGGDFAARLREISMYFPTEFCSGDNLVQTWLQCAA